MGKVQRITPMLWFDGQAEEAVKLYVSTFPNSRILGTSRYDEAGAKASGQPKGSVMTVQFELDGQEFTALNGGPLYKFTEAVSFVVNCDTQAEVDHYWGKLSEGGEEVQCGWLKDRFGLAWQVTPKILTELVMGKDPEKAKRAFCAMLQMKKLDIATLERAAEGR
jgi:predicted 3-demethylubiquinone-9 3-methyltransferase (glyoxalase superfamily)